MTGAQVERQYSSGIEHARNYMQWILDSFDPFIGHSVLEVGLGHGGYWQHLPARVERYSGFDVDPELVARAQLAHPELRLLHADLMNVGTIDLLSPDGWDTVICFNVLEHIDDDRTAVRHLLRLLSPGGHLLLFVPAFRTLFTELDRLAGHRRRYTLRTLATLFEPGPAFRRLEYFNPIGGIGWWLNGLWRHRELDSTSVNRQIALFDRYLLPLSRVLNRSTRRFFGQSAMCVVQRT